jgi:hypothetical protein
MSPQFVKITKEEAMSKDEKQIFTAEDIRAIIDSELKKTPLKHQSFKQGKFSDELIFRVFTLSLPYMKSNSYPTIERKFSYFLRDTDEHVSNLIRAKETLEENPTALKKLLDAGIAEIDIFTMGAIEETNTIYYLMKNPEYFIQHKKVFHHFSIFPLELRNSRLNSRGMSKLLELLIKNKDKENLQKLVDDGMLINTPLLNVLDSVFERQERQCVINNLNQFLIHGMTPEHLLKFDANAYKLFDDADHYLNNYIKQGVSFEQILKVFVSGVDTPPEELGAASFYRTGAASGFAQSVEGLVEDIGAPLKIAMESIGAEPAVLALVNKASYTAAHAKKESYTQAALMEKIEQDKGKELGG